MLDRQVTEHLYAVFSKYSTQGMTHCPCGCTYEERVQRILSTPLRALETGDLSYFHGSALFTWGEVEHYKHFLPRLLEQYSANRPRACVDVADIYHRLEYAQWRQWPQEEVAAIQQYVYLDWVDAANHTDDGIDGTTLGKYLHYLRLEQLLEAWEIQRYPDALQNFVWFWYREGNQVLSKGLKINGVVYRDELRALLDRPHLMQELEKLFFTLEPTDSYLAALTSTVLQMVEHEKMLGRSAQ